MDTTQQNNNPHNFMCENLLMPNGNKVDCVRGYMWSLHFSQSVNLENPEFPMNYTLFENQFGKESDIGFEKAERDYEVIGKVIKNENVYFLIIKYLDNNEYDYIERREDYWLTQKFGFSWDNEVIDSLEEGDIVEKGDVIAKCHNYDQNNNFGYGVNLKAVFFTKKLKTLEDAIVISKSAAKKLISSHVHKFKIVLNKNDLLLNKNKNPIDYKCYPCINEETKGFFAVRRRINNKKLYSFDNLFIDNITQGDEIFYCNGRVVDIDISSNLTDEELKGVYNTQILKDVKKRRKFNKEFYEMTKGFMEDPNVKYSDKMLQKYNEVKMGLNGVPYSLENSKFSGTVIEFTLMEKSPLNIGSKLSGRVGNKGVISDFADDMPEKDFIILDDDEMPYIEEGPFKGEHVEIFLNPNGVYNRINIAQFIEQEINFGAKWIRYKMSQMNKVEDKEKLYTQFLEIVSPKQLEKYREFEKTITEEEKKEFFKEQEERIYIYQPPFFGGTDLDSLKKMYETFPFIKPFKFKGINIPLIMGEIYFVRLYHESFGKLSARSTGSENLKNLPAKSKAFKEKKAHHSNNAVRLGNQEILNLLLTRNPKAIKYLLDSYSNNEITKKMLIEELICGDPYDINLYEKIKDKPELTKNETSKMLDTLLYTIGNYIEDV